MIQDKTLEYINRMLVYKGSYYDRISEGNGYTQALKDIKSFIQLKEAGCECKIPLLGYRPKVGPRCRLCNIVAEVEL